MYYSWVRTQALRSVVVIQWLIVEVGGRRGYWVDFINVFYVINRIYLVELILAFLEAYIRIITLMSKKAEDETQILCFSFSERLQGVYGFRSKGAIISLGMSSLTHWMFILLIIPKVIFHRVYEDDPEALNKFPLSLYYILANVAPIMFLYVFVPIVYYFKHPYILQSILSNLRDDLQELSCC